MKQPKISIVVPMYNVEASLPRCVESIIHQTYQNIEIILVDDESPDRSGLIAEEYAKKDDRIRVIHQKNKWLGGARNSGTRIANGEYVLFVDSDDYIRKDMCEVLVDELPEGGVDLLFFDTRHVAADGREQNVTAPPIPAGKVFRGNEVQEILYPLIIATHSVNSAWMKMYRCALLQERQLYFDEKIRYAEDYEFCLRLFPFVQTMKHCGEAFYYYVENPESIMHASDPKIVEKFLVLYRYREAFLQEHGLDSEDNLKESAALLGRMIVKNLPKYLGGDTGKSAKKAIDEICRNDELQNALNRISLSDSKLGLYGRCILWGLKHKKPGITQVIYQYLRR